MEWEKIIKETKREKSLANRDIKLSEEVMAMVKEGDTIGAFSLAVNTLAGETDVFLGDVFHYIEGVVGSEKMEEIIEALVV